MLENNKTYLNQHPHCEPQLGKRGLYREIGASPDGRATELALLWVLNLSDGNHSLLDICQRSGIRFELAKQAADMLEAHGLVERVPSQI